MVHGVPSELGADTLGRRGGRDDWIGCLNGVVRGEIGIKG